MTSGQRHTFRYHLVKSYYWCKGIYKMLFFFKKKEKYNGGASKSPSIYLGNGVFYETIYGTCGYVTTWKSQKQKYKIWHLGVLDWRKL